MRALLLALTERLTVNLPYLSWVGVIADPLLPPQSHAPPFVGLLDGGLSEQSLPNRNDLQTLTVGIVAYQALQIEDSGAAVLGEPSLGEGGKGLLEIQEDIRALLQDYTVAGAFSFAHRDSLEATQAIANDDNFLTMKQAVYRYQRLVRTGA